MKGQKNISYNYPIIRDNLKCHVKVDSAGGTLSNALAFGSLVPGSVVFYVEGLPWSD